jgi:transposase InsO family protein
VPWRVSDPVSERLAFVRRWLDGERVVDLCHEFGISRKTAYKMRARFEQLGPRGLFDLTRARKTQGLRTPAEVERAVLLVREKHPTWGPKKICAWLLAREPVFKVPCAATIGEILTRHQVVRRRMRRKTFMPYGAPLREAVHPNDVWCADFKGQFKLGHGRYCYPLTITDRFSRYVIKCEALENTRMEPAITVFDQAFAEYGLPTVIRTDNGAPFAGRGLWALTRLSVRWLRLGIWPERIAPSHPEQNGQHERMHLVLKQETTRPAGANFLQQQERFDRFVRIYNDERPHEALGQRPPTTLYEHSPRQMPKKLPDPEYPMHDATLRIHPSGDLWLSRRDYFRVSSVLAHELVGVREIDDGRWVVSFMHLDLGHYDCRTRVFEPIKMEANSDVA